MRRLLYRLLAQFCMECGGVMWPRQTRCGPRHQSCKHTADLAVWKRNDYRVEPWDCSFCKLPITTEARP